MSRRLLPYYRRVTRRVRIHEAMIRAGIRLEDALGPYIDKLKLPVYTVPDNSLQPITE